MSDRPEWAEAILAAVGQTRAEITQLGSEVAQPRPGVAQVRADVMERTDRLRDTATALQDEDVVNFGAAERAERIACNSREEVRGQGDTFNALVRAQREQINALVRQVRRPQSGVRGTRGEPWRSPPCTPGMAVPRRHARSAIAGARRAVECTDSAASEAAPGVEGPHRHDDRRRP